MTQVIRVVNKGAIDEMAVRFGWRQPQGRKSRLSSHQAKVAVELNHRYVVTAKGIMLTDHFLEAWRARGGRKFLELLSALYSPLWDVDLEGRYWAGSDGHCLTTFDRHAGTWTVQRSGKCGSLPAALTSMAEVDAFLAAVAGMHLREMQRRKWP